MGLVRLRLASTFDAEHPTFIPRYTSTTLQAPRGHMTRPRIYAIRHKVNSLLSQPSLSTREIWLLPQTEALCILKYQGVRASPVAPPGRPPQAIFSRRRRKNGPVTPPGARFSPAWAEISAGGPRPNPARWGALGGAGANCFGAKQPRARRVSDSTLFSLLCRPHRLVSRGESMPKLPRCRAGQPAPLMPHGRRSEDRTTRVPSPATRTRRPRVRAAPPPI